jgi:hypothetical protein
MPAPLAEPGVSFFSPNEKNSLFRALEHGYVVACPALRGRIRPYGKAPACIVDYKAAVRFLRHFSDLLPGDTEKIVTSGTSAGGALSALMGATGNHGDYEEFLSQIGAFEERDDVFAASCYCPITNLDNADMAYEWQFSQIYEYDSWKMSFENGKPVHTPVHGAMPENRIKASKELSQLFPEYVNSLDLRGESSLVLDQYGNGSFKDHIKHLVLKSAQAEMASGRPFERPAWLSENDIDFLEYAKAVTRMKSAPAFDDLALSSPENNLFGTEDLHARHFTSYSHDSSESGGELADSLSVRLLNPMGFIGDPGATCAKHWRIRHGTADRDTSLAISAILDLKLRSSGASVDYHLPWNVPHSGDYDLEELFSWIDVACQ